MHSATKILINFYHKKPKDYFFNLKDNIIELVSKSSNKILEIGCGAGATLAELKKQNPNRVIIGLDIVDINSHIKSIIDDFICANIEEIELPYPKGFFDTIIMADVIEHLINPWECVKNLAQYLSPNGCIIASIPNLTYHRVISNMLFKNEFEYQESGILDKTHLRFFTKKSIYKLFQDAGFNIINLTSFISTNKGKIINRLTGGIFEHLLTYKIIVQAFII